jgi:tRNA(Ile)-lysidine synthase
MNSDKTVFSPSALADVLRRLGLSPETPLKVAFSGGLDSCVLLHALCVLRDEMSLRLSAVHVDHGLQPASAAWAQHAEKFCEDLNVSCAIERLFIPDMEIRAHGLEAAARQARYACLARHVSAGDVLLTAHHVDDQAETLLLHLLRGSGTHGLAAMPEIAPFSSGRLARPLLGFTRAQLADYAEREKLRWVDDPSNRDPRFSRNYLRHEVFPLLDARWPGAARQIARAAALSAEAAGLLDAVAEIDWNDCRAKDPSALSVTVLRQFSPSRQRNLVRYWLRRQGFQAPSAMHLDQILAQVAHETRTRHSAVCWPDAEVRRYRDGLVALKSRRETDSAMRLSWDLSRPLEIPGVGRLHAMAARGDGLSQERIGHAPLMVGWRQGGETCQLPGRAHHHKLKKLLQEASIPPWERQRLPLVYAHGELAAIGDRWVCEPYAARAGEPGWKLRLELAQEFRGSK